MGRSKWKGSYIHSMFFKKKFLKKKQLIVWRKNSAIPTKLIDLKLLVYTGKKFKNIYISDKKIGYKFGEFCTTRIKPIHKSKSKNIKKKLKKK